LYGLQDNTVNPLGIFFTKKDKVKQKQNVKMATNSIHHQDHKPFIDSGNC